MRLLLVATATLLLAGGCAAPAALSPDASASSSDPAAPAHPEPRTWDVILQGRHFINDTVTIHVGDTVRWTHLDGSIGHSVMADDMAFSSNDGCMSEFLPHPLCMNDGDTFEVTFSAAGTVTYHCHAHHDTMKAKIVVLPKQV